VVRQVVGIVGSALGRTILHGCVVMRDCFVGYLIGPGFIPSGFSGNFMEWFAHSALVDRDVDCLYIVYICVFVWY